MYLARYLYTDQLVLARSSAGFNFLPARAFWTSRHAPAPLGHCCAPSVPEEVQHDSAPLCRTQTSEFTWRQNGDEVILKKCASVGTVCWLPAMSNRNKSDGSGGLGMGVLPGLTQTETQKTAVWKCCVFLQSVLVQVHWQHVALYSFLKTAFSRL